MTNALSISSQTQLVKLSKPQQGLLKLIQDAVTDSRTISMDDIVDCYCKSVKDYYYDPFELRRTDNPKEYNIYIEYRTTSFMWTYHIRGCIKSWFTNTIGTLVIKGKLLVLPIINVE